MPTSAQDLLKNAPKSSGANLLKGNDLGKKQDTTTIVVTELRKPPIGFNSPLILEVKSEFPGKTAFPVNRTNLNILSEQVGDNLDVLIGAQIVLRRHVVNNPQTRQMTYGLYVESVKLKGARK